jgi:hypothetical protein
VCVGWIEKWLMTKQSEESPNHGGMTCVVVELNEVGDRSDFEIIKSK